MVTSAKAFPWGAGILLLLATVTAAAAGAVISGHNSDPWYDALNKPVLTPPDILFVLVWPALFVLMAAGALLVLERAGSFDRAVSPLGLYYTMLAFNAGWSLAFFGMNEVALALSGPSWSGFGSNACPGITPKPLCLYGIPLAL